MIPHDLDQRLAATPGTVSAYVGRLDTPPAYTRQPDDTHYAASTMKIAVLAALHRATEAGTVDPDRPVAVRNEFDSAHPGAPRFGCAPDYDNDPVVWAHLDGTASLRWLARRMIVRSSNLATNIVLAHVGLPGLADVWRLAGAHHSVTERGIEDYAARDTGLTNLVTAADLAALLATIAAGATRPGPLAAPEHCAQMLEVLRAQEHRDCLPAGLPPGTPIAHKSGWITGVRHDAGVVLPADAPPYSVVVCTTADPAADGFDRATHDAAARRLIADLSAAAWQGRHG
ncbi:serine hydrolase [Polymorphospora lycopeni]|uniref:Serine hydrolase n=1 Tax=Polymorphospora lycopeni TaxID=3140240 RepID=A0ABV5CZ62_9ACTN